jgi:hypothetical protein
MIYILRETSVRGCLRHGRIEREGPTRLNVYDERTGELVDYFSGDRLRSWCIFGPDADPIEGWQHILPEDLAAIFPAP